MHVDIDREYAKFLEAAAADENVVGVVLSGSRGAGAYVTERSDFDVFVVVREATDAWPFVYGSAIEIDKMTLDHFGPYALPGDASTWNRAAFLFARVQIDKLDGEIGRLVERKRNVAPEEAAALADEALDGYINSLYRSLRNLEAGRDVEGRFDSADTIPHFLAATFALDGRIRPFNKWLSYDLAREPLSFEGVVEQAERILNDPAPAVQRDVFRRVEAHARARGHGALVDSWQPNVAWLRGDDTG